MLGRVGLVGDAGSQSRLAVAAGAVAAVAVAVAAGGGPPAQIGAAPPLVAPGHDLGRQMGG